MAVLLGIVADRRGHQDTAEIYEMTGRIASRWQRDEIIDLAKKVNDDRAFGKAIQDWFAVHGAPEEQTFFGVRPATRDQAVAGASSLIPPDLLARLRAPLPLKAERALNEMVVIRWLELARDSDCASLRIAIHDFGPMRRP